MHHRRAVPLAVTGHLLGKRTDSYSVSKANKKTEPVFGGGLVLPMQLTLSVLALRALGVFFSLATSLSNCT